MPEIKSLFVSLEKDILVFHNKNEIPYIASPHLHSQYEIYYNIYGAKGFMVNGQCYKCCERDLIVIPKVQAHKVLVKRNVEYERCIINIGDYTTELLEILSGNTGAMSFLFGGEKGEACMVNLTEKQHEVFMGLIGEYNELEKESDGLKMLSKFLEIMSFLKKRFENPKKAEYMDNELVSYTDRVIMLVEKNFKTASVSDIVSEIYANSDYVNRLFKEETGNTVNHYLIMRKIAEAKKFLYLGKSVKEACGLSGFGDYANFLRTFKKYEGYTPGELGELTQRI